MPAACPRCRHAVHLVSEFGTWQVCGGCAQILHLDLRGQARIPGRRVLNYLELDQPGLYRKLRSAVRMTLAHIAAQEDR